MYTRHCTNFSQKNTEDTVCLKSQEQQTEHTKAPKGVLADFQPLKIHDS